MREDNDLVVNTASMTSVEPGYLKDTWTFGTNGAVFHTNYFQQPEVPTALTAWWDLMPEMAGAEPPPAVVAPPSPPDRPRTRGRAWVSHPRLRPSRHLARDRWRWRSPPGWMNR